MKKFVVLLRHGIAEPHGNEPDETRALTEDGKRRMAQIALGLHKIFPKGERIISSPLKRAVQTAELVARVYGLEVETNDSLRPGSDPEAMRKLLDATAEQRIFLVGHEPALTAGMLHLTKLGSGGAMELKKGGCYGVRIEDGEARLEWMLPPRVLR